MNFFRKKAKSAALKAGDMATDGEGTMEIVRIDGDRAFCMIDDGRASVHPYPLSDLTLVTSSPEIKRDKRGRFA